MRAPADTPVLLFDGTCGVCAESVQFILTHDRKRTMRFAALDSAAGRAVIERHPEVLAFDSVLVVEPASDEQSERVFAYSDAVLRVAWYLGGAWRLIGLARIVPRPVRNEVYRLIARHRHRLSGTRPRCVIPAAADRDRFLE